MKLLRCGHEWNGEDVHYCPTRREPIYQDVEKVWRAEPPTCTCDLPRYKRHREPWECKKQRPVDWIIAEFGHVDPDSLR